MQVQIKFGNFTYEENKNNNEKLKDQSSDKLYRENGILHINQLFTLKSFIMTREIKQEAHVDT